MPEKADRSWMRDEVKQHPGKLEVAVRKQNR